MIITNVRVDDEVIGPFGRAGFPAFVDFEMSANTSADNNIEQIISDITHWVSHTFTKNFVIIEYATKRIAGGCVDNAGAIDKNFYVDNLFRPDYTYQLRCYPEDLTIFLLKYQINIKE